MWFFAQIFGFGFDSLFLKNIQLFERPDADQPASDALQRPLAHNWAAEQTSGEAK